MTQALALRPDVVVLDLHMPDGLGSEAAAVIARMEPAPGIVLFTGDLELVLSDEDVGGTRAFCVLPKPAPRAMLESTVRLAAARSKELVEVRLAAATAVRQLEERKLIERAKGILMRRTGTTEQEAYRILQRSSQDGGTPMITLARAVLDSEPGAAARG